MNDSLKARMKNQPCSDKDDIELHTFIPSDFTQITPGGFRKWKLRCKHCWASVEVMGTKAIDNHEINHDDHL